MEKFSLFDFLVFLIPGGAALMVFFWMLYSFSPDSIPLEGFPDGLLIIAGLMPAYILGHVLNYWGNMIEQKRSGEKKHWVVALQKDMALTIQLNQLCGTLFGFTFLDADNKIDEQKSGRFYDLAYATLEVSGLLEKIRVLYAQFKFLYNAVALSILSTVFALIILTADSFYGQNHLHPFYLTTSSTQAIILIMLSLFLGINAYRLAPRRRELKMTNTLNNFYVFNTLKIKSDEKK